MVSISEQHKKQFRSTASRKFGPTTHSFPKGQKVEIKVPYAVFIAQKDSTVSQAVSCWPLTAEAEFDSKAFRVMFVVDKDDLGFFRSTSVFPRLVPLNK